jgi:hypothetical protein
VGIFNWFKKILSYDPSIYKPPVEDTGNDDSGMNEGDFRSGPEGYSPNTAYPESFYGSGGASDDGFDEGDSNR